ncbi:MAG: hypothetical protein OFPII_40330 [Osedax symbiont Rs1]|nr:MAG: hypothetical protein OFPII_40330 [Osedax symbiont Rs1]
MFSNRKPLRFVYDCNDSSIAVVSELAVKILQLQNKSKT